MPKSLSASRGPDPRSERIALVYGGGASGDGHLSGVPSRDLTEHDLTHLASRRDIDPDALVAEFVASGLYARAED